MKKQSGFTLIELIVVITIIAILSAIAIPRFIELDTRARISSIEGLFGTVKSTSVLVHALVLAEQNPATVTIEGNVITNTNGYASAGTIDDAMDFTTGDYTFAVAGNTATFQLVGSPTPADCVVTYVESAALNLPPTITLTTTGC